LKIKNKLPWVYTHGISPIQAKLVQSSKNFGSNSSNELTLGILLR